MPDEHAVALLHAKAIDESLSAIATMRENASKVRDQVAATRAALERSYSLLRTAERSVEVITFERDPVRDFMHSLLPHY